jgi:hypothetical protein
MTTDPTYLWRFPYQTRSSLIGTHPHEIMPYVGMGNFSYVKKMTLEGGPDDKLTLQSLSY